MLREEPIIVCVALCVSGRTPGLGNTKGMFPTHCRDCIHPSRMAGAQMVCQTSKSASLSVSGHSSHLLLYQPNKSFASCAPVSGLGFEPVPVSLLSLCIYQVVTAIWLNTGYQVSGTGWPRKDFLLSCAKTQIS